MKLLSSHFTAPVLVAALTLGAGCSSDNSSPGNTAGTSSGGSASGGKPGTGGSVSAGGTAAGGAAAGGTAAGGAGTGGSAAGAAGAGTAGSGGASANYAAVQAIILRSCFGAICHDLAENPLKLKPVDTMYTTLTTHMTKNCGKLVNVASPAESALVKILQGSCGTTEKTDRMPYQTCFDGDTPDDNSACIATADIATIQAWITQGALQK